MAKKKFSSPFLILGGMSAGDDEVTGGGSGQSGQDSWLCDYNDWLLMYATDYNGDGEFSFDEYGKWFLENGGTPEQWEIFNDDPYPTPDP